MKKITFSAVLLSSVCCLPLLSAMENDPYGYLEKQMKAICNSVPEDADSLTDDKIDEVIGLIEEVYKETRSYNKVLSRHMADRIYNLYKYRVALKLLTSGDLSEDEEKMVAQLAYVNKHRSDPEGLKNYLYDHIILSAGRSRYVLSLIRDDQNRGEDWQTGMDRVNPNRAIKEIQEDLEKCRPAIGKTFLEENVKNLIHLCERIRGIINNQGPRTKAELKQGSKLLNSCGLLAKLVYLPKEPLTPEEEHLLGALKKAPTWKDDSQQMGAYINRYLAEAIDKAKTSLQNIERNGVDPK